MIGLVFSCSLRSPAQQNSYIDSTRPTISSGAAIQQKGVLQIESGYDAYFLPYDQTGATGFYYALSNWLRLDASVDAWRSTDVGVSRRTQGDGNFALGTKVVLFREGRSRIVPGFAVEYKDTFATASLKDLQSRYHEGTLIVSNKVGPWDWKVNGSLIGSSCDQANGCVVHGQGVLGVAYSKTHATTLDAEVFGQTVSVGAPPGAYAFAGLSHHMNERLDLNGGLRFGLNSSAPSIGVTFGVTVGIGAKPRHH